jgi:hypothetical protein
MKTAVKDVMTTEVVAVRRGATFKEMAAALRDHLSYPDVYSIVAGPVR